MRIFISLGPACMTAGILQNSGLRDKSFPLDWARSGSNQLPDLFALTPAEFYIRHIHHANISLDSFEDSYNKSTEMYSLLQRPVKYGFSYFWNPHRPMGQNKDYHLRCLERFHKVVRCNSVFKEFLLVTYPEKPGECYFLNAVDSLGWLDEIACKYMSAGSFRFTICEVIESQECLPYCHAIISHLRGRVLRVHINSALEVPYYHQVIASLLWTKSERIQFMSSLDIDNV